MPKSGSDNISLYEQIFFVDSIMEKVFWLLMIHDYFISNANHSQSNLFIYIIETKSAR